MDLGPIAGDFQAVSEDEYEDLMMEVDIENMEANVVEISDEESNDDDGGNAEVYEADENDVKMVVFGLNANGTKWRGLHGKEEGGQEIDAWLFIFSLFN